MAKNKSWNVKTSRFKKLKQVFSFRNPEVVLTDLLCQDTAKEILPEKMYWMEQLLQWLFLGEPDRIETRFQYLFLILEKNPEWKQNAQDTFAGILAECDFFSWFTQVGIAVEYGLWSDISRRIVNKLIPVGGSYEFREIIVRVFRSSESVDQLNGISDQTILNCAALLSSGAVSEAWIKIRKEIQSSMLSISTHVAHYGVGHGIRTRLTSSTDISSISFFNLSKSFQLKLANSEKLKCVEICENDIKSVYERMEETGVNVGLVNNLETTSALLRRIRILIQTESAFYQGEPVREVRSLIADLIHGSVREQLVLEPIRRHFYLLSRKIAERNGTSGEHYIAHSRPELKKLFWSSVGGGCVVVLMAILKNGLMQMHPAPLYLAMAIWIVYAAGFLLMQFLGFTLATKIPSFTASRLASLLKGGSERSELKAEFRSTIVSQALALFGNVMGVIPFVLFISFILNTLSFKVLGDEYAVHTIDQLHPFLSTAIPLGMLTGVLLWLSSIAGGWFENWIVFSQIPQAIENDHRIRKIFGEKSAKKIAKTLLNQSSGFATNVSLGFLFGFSPLIGGLLGFNWNSHHVTISTAGATLAAFSMDFQLTQSEWIWGVVGLLLIGAMNFGVSFGLSLFVAANAQRIHFRRVLRELF